MVRHSSGRELNSSSAASSSTSSRPFTLHSGWLSRGSKANLCPTLEVLRESRLFYKLEVFFNGPDFQLILRSSPGSSEVIDLSNLQTVGQRPLVPHAIILDSNPPTSGRGQKLIRLNGIEVHADADGIEGWIRAFQRGALLVKEHGGDNATSSTSKAVFKTEMLRRGLAVEQESARVQSVQTAVPQHLISNMETQPIVTPMKGQSPALITRNSSPRSAATDRQSSSKTDPCLGTQMTSSTGIAADFVVIEDPATYYRNNKPKHGSQLKHSNDFSLVISRPEQAATSSFATILPTTHQLQPQPQPQPQPQQHDKNGILKRTIETASTWYTARAKEPVRQGVCSSASDSGDCSPVTPGIGDRENRGHRMPHEGGSTILSAYDSTPTIVLDAPRSHSSRSNASGLLDAPHSSRSARSAPRSHQLSALDNSPCNQSEVLLRFETEQQHERRRYAATRPEQHQRQEDNGVHSPPSSVRHHDGRGGNAAASPTSEGNRCEREPEPEWAAASSSKSSAHKGSPKREGDGGRHASNSEDSSLQSGVQSYRSIRTVPISLGNIVGTRVQLGDMDRFGVVQGMDISTGKYEVLLDNKCTLFLHGEVLNPLTSDEECGTSVSDTLKASSRCQEEWDSVCDDSVSDRHDRHFLAENPFLGPPIEQPLMSKDIEYPQGEPCWQFPLPVEVQRKADKSTRGDGRPRSGKLRSKGRTRNCDEIATRTCGEQLRSRRDRPAAVKSD